MQGHLVSLSGLPPFACADGQSLLAAMEAARRADIPVGCRNGGCGVCKVQVVSGAFDTGRMSRAQVTADDQARGVVLACRIYPRGALIFAV